MDYLDDFTSQADTVGGDDASYIKDHIAKNLSLGIPTKWQSYCSERRKEKHKQDSYRKGPAPIEEAESMRKGATQATYGTLDSDCEDLEFEEDRKNGSAEKEIPTGTRRPPHKKRNSKGHSLASCRALIVYFSKLAKTRDEDETVDLSFVDSLLQNGADINFSDHHGQTAMHEIARAWHPDVAKFALQQGADVNKPDTFGRTPLHLAAAVDYEDMVEFLCHNGANIESRTLTELQTPMHYAAKNNGTASLKMLLKLGAGINVRDYKQRTPVFVAAETARSDASRYLVEQGAPVGVYDDSGSSCLALMIEKMPHIAMEAVEQFHMIDRAFRKHYYYLGYLEADEKYLPKMLPKGRKEKEEQKQRDKDAKKAVKEKGGKIAKQPKTAAKTPLEVIIQYNQLDLIMHPVFQRLIAVKWNLFGKFGSSILVSLNLFYTLLWTVLGIFFPRRGNFYSPLGENWWRLVLEIIGVLMTVYFIVVELLQIRMTEKRHNKWRAWRMRQVERDLKFCHPRWPEEKKYLESELQQIRTYQRTYFRDPWNIFEWISYFVILTLIATRVMSLVSSDDENSKTQEVHRKVYSLGLVIIWLRFMRTCRAFRSIGPFIAILGSVIADTLKFAFLFFEFFIPYTVGFWIVFGGSKNAITMGDDSAKNWEHFNDLTFSVWEMTLVGDFDFGGLVAVDRLMAQILVGTYFALVSVVCLNLYIALLSDTFARVYAQAQANAGMQQATLVSTIERTLSKKKLIKFGHHMKEECAPEEVYARDEGNSPDDHENDMFEKVVRQISNRIDEFEDNMKEKLATCGTLETGGGTGGPGMGGPSGGKGPGGGGGQGQGGNYGNFGPTIAKQNQQIHDISREMMEIKRLLMGMGGKPGLVNFPVGASAPIQVNPSPSLRGPPSSVGYPTTAPILPRGGYTTDPETAGHLPLPKKKGKRGRGRNRAGQGGYDSDVGSTYSENLPMLRIQQRGRSSSPHSAQSVPVGKQRKGKKRLSGSWEDIKADLSV